MRRVPTLLINVIAFAFLLVGIDVPVTPESREAPKHIILMISDGCGYNHIDAANLFQFGKTGVQSYEKFPVQIAMSTYSTDGNGYDPEKAWKRFDYIKLKPTDSAASITAMSTGVKTYNGAICVDVDKKPLENIVDRVEKFGMSTGVVTTVQLSHATPAGVVAHNVNRNHYEEIAWEMIYESPLEVVMGCGHPLYDESGLPVNPEEREFKYVGGESTWEELVRGKAQNDADGDGIPDRWTLIQDRSEFQTLMSGKTPKRVIGIPRTRSTLQQKRNGKSDAKPFEVPLIVTVPTLSEMTKAALNVLDNDPDGFFVMIEGGAVDWASHGNQSGRMIEEQIDLHHAVDAVIDWVETKSSWDETLVIITSDHECGYLTGSNSGPDHVFEDNTIIPVWSPLINRGKGQTPGMEWHSNTHTNSLVPFFAKGIGSKAFHRYANRVDPVHGKYLDNTNIAHVLFSFFQKVE